MRNALIVASTNLSEASRSSSTLNGCGLIALYHFLSRFSRSCLPCDLNFIQVDCNRLAVLRPFIAPLRTPGLNEKLDAVTTILCRANAYKEIPHIVSASLYLIDAGFCHPVDNLD